LKDLWVGIEVELLLY